MTRQRPTGSVLLAVVLLLTMLSLLAWWLATDGGSRLSSARSDRQADTLNVITEAALAHARSLAGSGSCPGNLDLLDQTLGEHSYDLSLLNTRQPQTQVLGASDDTYIKEDDTDKTNETHADLHTKLDGGRDEHGLIRFNTASIAPGTRIESARLYLYVVDDDPEAAVAVHENNAAWDEASADWDNMGSSYDSAAIGYYGPSADKDHWVSVPVTAAVQRWVNTPLSNHGLRLIAQSDNEVGKVASKEHGTTAYHPYLEVVTSAQARTDLNAKVRARLASGEIGPYRTETIPLRQAPGTLVLQPGSEGVDATYEASNDGDDNRLRVDASANRHAALRFDVEQLPTGSHIVSAELQLYVRDVSKAGSVQAQAFLEYWTEGNISNTLAQAGTTWDRGGGDVDAARRYTAEVPARNTWMTINVTEIAQRWVDGAPAYGVRLQSLGATADFASSDEANQNQHPRLVIHYACDCGASCEPLLDSHDDDLLFLVDDENSLTDGERRLFWNFQRWGYDVELQSDGAFVLGALFSLPGKEVVYVSRSTNPSLLGGLRSTGAGIVSEHPDTASGIRVANSPSVVSGSALSIDQTNHPITTSLPSGPLPLADVSLALNTHATPAAGALALGSSAGRASLLALPVGATNTTGGSAPSNRVMLPFAATEVWNLITSDAEQVVRRSLRWAASGIATEIQCEADYAPTAIERRVTLDTLFPAGLEWLEEGAEFDGETVGADGAFVVASTVESALIFYQNDGTRAGTLTLPDAPSGVTYIAGGRFAGEYAYVDDAAAELVVVEPDGKESLRFSTSGDGLFTPAGIAYIGATASGTYDDHIAIVGASSDQIAIVDQNENLIDRFDVSSPSWVRGATHLPGSDKLLVTYADFARIYELDGTLVREYSVASPEQTPGVAVNGDTCQHVLLGRSLNELLFLKQAPVALAFFPMSEGAGGTTEDTRGGRMASLSGASWEPTGVNGSAIDFDGSNDAVELPHDPTLALTGALTVSAWINPDTVSGRQAIVSHGSYFELALDDSEVAFRYVGTGTEEFVSSGAGVRADRWQHVTAVSDGTNVSLLLDGTSVLSMPRPDAPSASTEPLLIGSNGDDDRFDGSIDEVEIFDEALSFSEAEAAAAAASPPPPPPALACATASDDFETRDYSGSTGDPLWTGPWIEVSENDGPTSGDEVIGKPNATWTLRVQDNDGGGEGVERGIDLLTYSSATLNFDYWRSGLESSDYVRVELSSDAGASWTEIMRIQGPGTDDPFSDPISVSVPFSVPLNEDNRLRFRTWWLMGPSDRLFIDNVAITACP